MNILVTGASGFIGSELCSVVPNVIRVVRQPDQLKSYKDILIPNIDSSTSWGNSLIGIDSIIHLAGLAHNPNACDNDYKEVNVHGTLKLAHEAVKAGVARFVFVSSIGVNGTNSYNKAFLPSDIAKPHNTYAQSKYDAELGLWEISEKTGLEIVIVRPTLVYGSAAPGNFGMLANLVKHLPFLPFGLANNRRDFISVSNLVELLVVCAKHQSAPGNVFLASECNTVSTKEFVNAIASGQDRKICQIPIPVTLMRLVGLMTGKSTMIEQLFGNLEVDSSNIKEVLGWTPPYSMKDTMDMLRK
ncbi:UDP-glucose 4-epimerase [Vibrio nigripulchritudo SO65]|uniref:NAD-dependent epimerase/dehydratase family protein n=1 Tax=Vibrio nigripulchritudo TaxID=28173 RepID=UPI0003B1D067|nr:NAD-dependent epimerase/dehydratase family protein [Vibrio nigripulchritudo]CCN35103.1 UDP-glucose 4-epimerase [Vibrio nigripulchritudo AM115]CCN41697.1 UDP-glucose 4-epimerase [Vibrio nigripulchritudo FTn2]CCN65076.1 Nucleoside-diphosphate-sugar epimerase [Vibrio nigripulchritudo POn4]CCN75187.1 UDP-glucose 4-epimerase [Vibrio nigripulchritudo SO65]